jgi:hypothetical protein
MAIQTNYNFNGIEVKDAYIRIDRLFGSKREGWNSLVGVYNITTEAVPAVPANAELNIPAQEATTRQVFNKIEEFNYQVPYSADERGYVSVYKSLQKKFGGTNV